MVKRISIFDFDGTLINTPVPESGRLLYERVTGREWPHKGWWSKPDSLDMTIFDMSPIQSAATAYGIERHLPDTLVVMMTGRIQRLSKHVEKILHAKGYVFDEYVYQTGQFGSDTLSYKIGMFEHYKAKFPELESMAIWEDRVEHATSFKEWGAKQEGFKFELTLVENDPHQ